jgi:hypothetical protein
MALEGEIASWREFRGSLGSIGSREDLDCMFDQARANCIAAGNAVRPVVFEWMFMAIAFSHEKRLAKLRRAMERLRIEIRPEKESAM